MRRHFVGNVTRTFVVLVGILVLGACAGPKYEQDYKSGTDFGGYQSYAWDSSNSQIQGVNSNRLRQLTHQTLAEQGLVSDEEDPDLLIGLNAFTRQATGGSKGIGLSIGVPIGSSGRVGVGGSKSLDDDKQEGVLVLDITDAETKDLLWRGTAAGIPLSQFRLDEEQRLKQTIEKLVAQFPPE